MWVVSIENNVNKTKRSNGCNRTSISSIDCQIVHDFARSKFSNFSDKTLSNLFSFVLVFNLLIFLSKGGFVYKIGEVKGGS